MSKKELLKDIDERIDGLSMVIENIIDGSWNDRYTTQKEMLKDLYYQTGFIDALIIIKADIENSIEG